MSELLTSFGADPADLTEEQVRARSPPPKAHCPHSTAHRPPPTAHCPLPTAQCTAQCTVYWVRTSHPIDS